MENITLEIEENSLAQQFELDIPDDSMVINVKINFEIAEGEEVENAVRFLGYGDIRKYVTDIPDCKILFSSAGVHLNGESKRPHIHYNFITTPFHPPSNLSQHRSRWLKKQGDPDLYPVDAFSNVSFKFQSLQKNKPKYSVLSYPLKEKHFVNVKGLYIYNDKPMTKEQKTFLVDTGSAIYEKEVGLKLRQDKCEERKKLALSSLYELVSKQSFSTFKEMMLWLDDNYISTLELEDYPDPKNYKVNCQKIAVKLKILKYSDI